MKNIFTFLTIILFCVKGFAQQALWSGQAIVSPEIHADNSVTFRLYAPQATTVQISGDWMPKEGWAAKPASMIKDTAGLWSHTTNILPSELYSYTFIINGVQTTDPNNVYLIRDVASVTNVFIIKGNQSDLYSVNQTPHGSVARRWYSSNGLNMQRRITIYTPAGYEQSKEKYPVLYLLHGMGGDEEAWMALGRTAQILDNLIAAGKATPMIVVMPNGNMAQQAAPGESPEGLIKPTFHLPHTMDGLIETCFPEIVDFIDKNYRTMKEKKGRAIAGLSMGGFHAMNISRQYPDMFDYVGLFSAAIEPNKGIKSPIYDNPDEKLKVQFSKNPKLYWIGIGKEDFLYKSNQEYLSKLRAGNYPFTYYENSEGHIWKNWRIYLSEFAPLLFKP